jgi:hypothetical protein
MYFRRNNGKEVSQSNPGISDSRGSQDNQVFSRWNEVLGQKRPFVNQARLNSESEPRQYSSENEENRLGHFERLAIAGIFCVVFMCLCLIIHWRPGALIFMGSEIFIFLFVYGIGSEA